MINQTENILSKLKRATAEIHQRTEELLPFGSQNLALPVYKNLLVRFYNFYQICEPELICSIEKYSVDFDYQTRLKTSKIASDLKNLGVSTDKLLQIVSSVEIPRLNSRAKIFGALYVVEGSTLGGQIISRELRKLFGFDETNGAAFFSGYGAQTGAMWNEFRSAITDFATFSANDIEDEIISAALETFEKLLSCLRSS